MSLAVEVWPGNTADRSAVTDRIQALKDKFGINSALFVGDGGMYSEATIEKLKEFGFDYILRTEWPTQRQQLEALAPRQLKLFNAYGAVEWEQDGVLTGEAGVGVNFRKKYLSPSLDSASPIGYNYEPKVPQ